ncbi:MAG: NUDIX hydrolase [Nocardioidaceae bacterium]
MADTFPVEPRLTDDERRWEVIGDDEVIHDGWIRVSRRTYRLPDGREAIWEMFGGGHSVGVLALTPEGRLVCVRQFRPGPDRVVLNIPGGFVDRGETFLEAAARELTEETGYVSTDLEHVVTARATFSTGQRHVVIARNCLASGVQLLDDFEDCEPVVLDISDVRAQLRAGAMTGSDLVYLGLDHAGLL